LPTVGLPTTSALAASWCGQQAAFSNAFH